MSDENKGDGSREMLILRKLVVNQQADHQSEIEKRDHLISQLQNLFKEAELKQEVREKEV
jgi:hypothetical protein